VKIHPVPLNPSHTHAGHTSYGLVTTHHETRPWPSPFIYPWRDSSLKGLRGSYRL